MRKSSGQITYICSTHTICLSVFEAFLKPTNLLNYNLPMALYHLVYQSKVIHPFSDAELAVLLEKAREFNAQYNVTGLLMYGYGSFLQLLEGDDDVIKSLYYLRISTDPRHYSTRVLREGPAEKRLFERWAMAFRPIDATLFKDVNGFVHPDVESEYGRNLLAPLATMQALEMLSIDLKRKENNT